MSVIIKQVSGWLLNRDRIRRRLAMSLAGVAILGVAVGVNMSARLGMDPFGAFVAGTGLLSGLSYGVMFMAVQAVLALLAFFLDKHYLHVSTVLSLLLVGPIAQVVHGFIDLNFPMQGLVLRLIVLMINLVFICLGSSFYMTADLGVSSYDAMPIIAANKTGRPFRFMRIISDSICAFVGFLCGADVGIGTLLTALALGPVIDIFNRKVSQPLLYGWKGQSDDRAGADQEMQPEVKIHR